MSRRTNIALSVIAGVSLYLHTSNTIAQEPDPQVNLDEIVVTATRSEKERLKTPAAVTVQDFDELRQKGFTYGNRRVSRCAGCILPSW